MKNFNAHFGLFGCLFLATFAGLASKVFSEGTGEVEFLKEKYIVRSADGSQDQEYDSRKIYLVAPDSVKLSIASFGIYERQVSERNISYKLIEESRRIPNRQGILFGFMYEIGLDNLVPGMLATFPLVERYRHPGLRNPEDGRLVKLQETQDMRDVGVARLLYELTYDWEMEPGEWVFEVASGDKVLLKQEFEVYDP